jgi:hypothetical protein
MFFPSDLIAATLLAHNPFDGFKKMHEYFLFDFSGSYSAGMHIKYFSKWKTSKCTQLSVRGRYCNNSTKCA